MISLCADGGLTATPLPDEGDGPANVLLLAPSMEAASDDACAELRSGVESAETDLLAVTTDRSPDERLAALGREGAGPPARMAVVSVGEETRSAAASGSPDAPLGDARFQTTTVPEPGDLTGLGMRMSRALEAWQDDGRQSVVCVDSLTTLLRTADPQRVFRFLHMITNRVETADCVAHYHMDPDAHDDRTVAMIRSLFDVVFAYRDGDWHRE